MNKVHRLYAHAFCFNNERRDLTYSCTIITTLKPSDIETAASAAAAVAVAAFTYFRFGVVALVECRT